MSSSASAVRPTDPSLECSGNALCYFLVVSWSLPPSYRSSMKYYQLAFLTENPKPDLLTWDCQCEDAQLKSVEIFQNLKRSEIQAFQREETKPTYSAPFLEVTGINMPLS